MSRKFLVQYAAGICATLTVVTQGVVLAWPSPAIPKLLNGESGVVFTKEQCSWVASIISLGAIAGCITTVYLADIIGRKKTVIISTIPSIIGSVIQIVAVTPIPLCVARFLIGGGAAMSIIISSIYTGEIADKKIRGALGTFLTTMSISGNLLMYTIGPYVTYSVLNYICLSIPIIGLVSCLWIPESPYYFLKKDDIENAKLVMLKLKRLNKSDFMDKELLDIHQQVKSDMQKKSSTLELLRNPTYRRAIKILAGLKFIQIMTGGMVIQSYLESIFRQTNMNISPGTASIIYGVVQLLSGFIATVLVDRMGRRPLLLTSSSGVAVLLGIVGLYFYLQDSMVIEADTLLKISWIPVVGILLFITFYSIGVGNLPYVVQSEIFPTNMRSLASSYGTLFGASLSFGSTKAYQGIVNTLGICSVFWIFGIVAFAGVFFVYFVVPETKGKTLEEIGAFLNGEKINNTTEVVPLQNK